jgi:hypothetical protein
MNPVQTPSRSRPNAHDSMKIKTFKIVIIFSYSMNVTLDGVWIGYWIYLPLNAQLVITLNYSAIADFYTLPITTAHAKSFPASGVFTNISLVTASNNGYSSASLLKSSLCSTSLSASRLAAISHQPPLLFTTDLVAPAVFLITPPHGPRRQHTVHSRMLTVSAGMCLPSRSLAAAVCSCLLRLCCLPTNVVPLCFAAVA